MFSGSTIHSSLAGSMNVNSKTVHFRFKQTNKQTNKRKQLVHKSIQSILVPALTLHATANLLSVLELNQSGDGLQLDQRMLAIGMVRIALVSLSLHKAHQSRIVLLIFQEEIDHGVSGSRIRKR